MPECLSDRVFDWFAAAVDRIDSNLQQINELEQTSSREAHWPRVRSEIESLRNEVGFLRIGYELLMELRDALINEYRERNRNNDESVPVLLSPGQPPDVPIPAGRLSVGGEVVAFLNSIDGSGPEHGRIPPFVFLGTSSGRSQGREVNNSAMPLDNPRT
jgi:hypothetical protein